VTLAINRQSAVSPKPVYPAAIAGGEADAKSSGGFQKHLDQSLQSRHDTSPAEGGAVADDAPRTPEEKAGRKRKIAENLAAPVTAQPAADRQLIPMPAGCILTLDMAPETEVESANRAETDADSAAGAITTLPLLALSDAGSKAKTEAARSGMATATPPVAGTAIRQAEAKPNAGSSSVNAEGTGGGKPDELAFAARVQPVDAAARADTAAAPPLRTASKTESIAKAGTEDKVREPLKGSGRIESPTPRLNLFEPTPTQDATPRVENTPEVVRADMPVLSPSKSVAPLRDLSVQMGQAADQRVEVRLTQRGSELHVTVSTANLDLSRGLRQGIPEVVTRLSESGFRTETWHPGATATAVTAATEAGNASSDFQRQDPQSRGGTHQQDQQQQRGQQHTDRPKWLEELEDRFSNRESRGDSHGFSN
jgi:hypothetical protein